MEDWITDINLDDQMLTAFPAAASDEFDDPSMDLDNVIDEDDQPVQDPAEDLIQGTFRDYRTMKLRAKDSGRNSHIGFASASAGFISSLAMSPNRSCQSSSCGSPGIIIRTEGTSWNYHLHG